MSMRDFITRVLNTPFGFSRYLLPAISFAMRLSSTDRCEMAIAGFQRNVAYETLTSRA
jgi:hypothetical protein